MLTELVERYGQATAASGYTIARYVSLEQRVFETKERYYAALIASQRSWHDAKHDPWPWLEYLIGVVDESYVIFEQRLATAMSAGSKQERVRGYVLREAGREFKISDIRRAVPGARDQTIRLVLGALRDEGAIKSTGVGPRSIWHRRLDLA